MTPNKKKYFRYFRWSIYFMAASFLIITIITSANIYFFKHKTQETVNTYIDKMNIQDIKTDTRGLLDSSIIRYSFILNDKGLYLKIRYFPLGIGLKHHETVATIRHCDFLLEPDFGNKPIVGLKLGDNSCSFRLGAGDVKENYDVIKIYFVRGKTSVFCRMRGPKGDKDILESDEYKEVLKLLEYIDGVI